MKNKPIIIWLLLGCFLIFVMVVVGGITRLTDSGLSMVNWNLFMGVVPPLNNAEWLETFAQYQQSPEGRKLNYNISLSEFKFIFFWEYLHRMMGRLLGLVFIVPFTIFIIRGQLNKKLLKQTIILLFLGSLQGAIGWWMVKSGLVDNPHVSHYRLSVHLIIAFLTCAFTLWVALPLIFNKTRPGNIKIKNLLLTYFFIVIIQIIYGAFVAGLDAGGGYNTWPKMLGEWVPAAVYMDVNGYNPKWFIEHIWGVQFIHRTLGILVLAFTFYVWNTIRKNNPDVQQIKSSSLLLVLMITQTILGISTLIYSAPLFLALMHQVTAFFIIMTTVYCIFLFKKA